MKIKFEIMEIFIGRCKKILKKQKMKIKFEIMEIFISRCKKILKKQKMKIKFEIMESVFRIEQKLQPS